VAAQPTIASRTTRIEMSTADRAADVWRGVGDVSRCLLVAIGDTMRIRISTGRGRMRVAPWRPLNMVLHKRASVDGQ
jgi:hypothetical protein